MCSYGQEKSRSDCNIWHGTSQSPWSEMADGVLVGFEDLLSFEGKEMLNLSLKNIKEKSVKYNMTQFYIFLDCFLRDSCGNRKECLSVVPIIQIKR